MNETLNDIARAHLAQHGLGEDIAGLVEMWLSPEDQEGAQRANISVGYLEGGKRRETTMVSTPTLDDALTMLADRKRIGAVLSLGIMASPKSVRPALPDWILDNEEARRTRQGLRRASSLADDASRGRTTPGDAVKNEDAPF